MAKVPKVALFIESHHHFDRELTQGIAHYSRLYGPWTFYRIELGIYKRTRKTTYGLEKWEADGIITRDPYNFEAISELGLPTIFASTFPDRSEGVIEVITDDKQIAQLACEHFIGRGFRDFAFCGFKDMPWSKRREISFQKELNDKGFKANIFNSQSTRMSNWDKEHPRIIKWLETLPKPIAILCCNDDRGNDLIEVCKTCGLNVPYDVAVLGVDNDRQICELSNPLLSSISLSIEKAGFEAASVLDKLMSGQPAGISEIKVEPTTVVTRQSTDTFAISDPQVARALHYINNNQRTLIQVEDVLNDVACSRKTLDDKFIRFLGCTVFAEIRRVRTENIAKMLLETNSPISQIAYELGYSDADHIARFFRQEKDITPQAYRQNYALKSPDVPLQ